MNAKDIKFARLWILLFLIVGFILAGSVYANSAQSETSTVTATAVDTDPHAYTSSTAAATLKSDSAIDDTTVVDIPLDDLASFSNTDSVSVAGSSVTLHAAGTYRFSGTLSEGQILVDAGNDDIVKLILNGVTLQNSASAPIAVINAEEVVIVLADGSENTLSDSADASTPAAEDEMDAVIYSKADLIFSGNGMLTIQANRNDAINSRDDLVIENGTYILSSVDDGLIGKDAITIQSGSLTITAQGDGMKATNDEDPSKGFITILGGNITLNAQKDGIDAETVVTIAGGTLDITAGSGLSSLSAEDSAKGIKAASLVQIDDGTLTINALDDAIHSNDQIVINDGSFTISTQDDAIHADTSIEINSGMINILSAYEGIESAVITLNDGEINILSSDDGINVSDGSGGGMGQFPDRGNGQMGQPPAGFGNFGQGKPNRDGAGMPPSSGFQGNQTYSGTNYLYINGGTIIVRTSTGDGVDVNGAIEMTGGTLIVDGPTNAFNGSIDYDGTFNVSGGIVAAAGVMGMNQNASASSTQNSVMIRLSSSVSAGTAVSLIDASGKAILSLTPTLPYQVVIFSSPELVSGAAYTVQVGGITAETSANGLVLDTDISGGTQAGSFTIHSTVTSL